ncbi:glycine-rich RNA-binding protein 10-like [Capsicum annuum]|uniref:glycine-rich RNA-binding protein 10-like n=1 Tax=Capsicum annuum TaxID=4072 RepID=UPI001FB15212|nr:glycine-rich RNA-binding protein 10-like [Capsicum annuum]
MKKKGEVPMENREENGEKFSGAFTKPETNPSVDRLPGDSGAEMELRLKTELRLLETELAAGDQAAAGWRPRWGGGWCTPPGGYGQKRGGGGGYEQREGGNSLEPESGTGGRGGGERRRGSAPGTGGRGRR